MSLGDSRAVTLVLVLAVVLAGCDMVSPPRSQGEKIYRARCAECHGFDGRGNTIRYMSNPRADLTSNRLGSVEAMEPAIRDGVPGEMPAFSELTYTEMKALLGWIRQLRGDTP